uniref:Uncharacterized protein n=2 Tax=Enterobacteriaceae TaxID=543 RepID=A0A482M5P8_KLEPN|nr:hypothetical protein [Enterobacter cloacae]QBQ68044.1 hypothetical protein [Klebsiella pneumoniae]QLG00900.1 hypothetical protein [Enterobacter cloacae]QUW40610.1 hypothetical protein [Raoultella ornithinolytica]
MNSIESSFINTDIKYLFQPAKQDRKHLLVIFLVLVLLHRFHMIFVANQQLNSCA